MKKNLDLKTITPILTTKNSNAKTLCVIAGPTASGKTDLSINLALHFNTSIISADSRQFYKELIIGAATPTVDQLNAVNHFFIGNLSVTDNYNVSKFEVETLQRLDILFQEKDIVFLTGGSGLYIDAVCKGIDILPDPDLVLRAELNNIYQNRGIEPLLIQLEKLDLEYYKIVDKANPVRIIRAIEVCLQTGKTYTSQRKQIACKRDFNIIKICINRPREELNDRINQRTELMIKQGLIDEVKSLLPYKNLNSLKTVGYKEIFEYLDGIISIEQAIENIKTNTRRYAKRQLTWFRRDKEYSWFSANEESEIIKFIKSKL